MGPLLVPMKYDTQRHCSTVLGWNDPRGCDDDGEPLLIDGGRAMTKSLRPRRARRRSHVAGAVWARRKSPR